MQILFGVVSVEVRLTGMVLTKKKTQENYIKRGIVNKSCLTVALGVHHVSVVSFTYAREKKCYGSNKILGPLLTTAFLPEVELCHIHSLLLVLLFGVLL